LNLVTSQLGNIH